jgi:hypothetical protein
MMTESTIFRVMYGTRGNMREVARFTHAIDARAYIRDEWTAACRALDCWHETDIESVVVPAIMRLPENAPNRVDHPMIDDSSCWQLASARIIGAYGVKHETIIDRALALGAESVRVGWQDGLALPCARAYMHPAGGEGSARTYVDLRGAYIDADAGTYHPIAESWFDCAGDPMPAPADAQVSA